VRFWDSSAIIPLLVTQSLSGRADAWLGEDAEFAVWTLTTVEITSALRRLVRDELLEEDGAHFAERRADEFLAAAHTVQDVEAVKAMSRRLLRVHALRAADALQLAAAVIWAAGQPQGKTLHTLDDRLAIAARREGFEVP
jgi:predicted nucleic acid-binding protein